MTTFSSFDKIIYSSTPKQSCIKEEESDELLTDLTVDEPITACFREKAVNLNARYCVCVSPPVSLICFITVGMSSIIDFYI